MADTKDAKVLIRLDVDALGRLYSLVATNESAAGPVTVRWGLYGPRDECLSSGESHAPSWATDLEPVIEALRRRWGGGSSHG